MYEFYKVCTVVVMRNNNLKGWLTLGGLMLSLIGIYYLLFWAIDFLDTLFVGKIVLLYLVGAMLIIESRSTY